MIALGDLLVALLDAVPDDAGGVEDGVRVEVDAIELRLPIESRLRAGRFDASMPRGRVATGFDQPHGSLQVSFARGDG